ncbi:hypothetical protein IFM89_002947 [Coptis chinensis]|uniref:Pectinesterase catalytic domain-containing protein n=1 Tax=Coptis chinensis TaxID=261450 RepID=A0A835M772_9MAGN|nr:hypothetical protein IFM89_002947 [Coptis chinensis]
MGRVLAAGISIIFVDGVIVDIVVTVNRGSGNTSHQSNGGLSTGMKAVETLHRSNGLQRNLLEYTQSNCQEKYQRHPNLKDLVKATFQAAQKETSSAATSAVEHSNFDTMSDRVDDLKTWSSTVIALKTTCLDDLLEKPGLQKTMQDDLMNATQITFNALAIVNEISQILSKVNTVVGDGFIVSSMGFENVAGPEGDQAVAFHSK